ncbi:hypothetical protein PROFUN_02304 [Planoprotostelium fungivorum]|uniref:LysM domain-containing protein n=1 Tax=Planoprotostelium fungivorum TaxID=1890364 RepID=A0A2P6NYJ0_9EUKA|nr:hypothetical protein PROFUN_02304 [Planoprotostelium fungivorum]
MADFTKKRVNTFDSISAETIRGKTIDDISDESAHRARIEIPIEPVNDERGNHLWHAVHHTDSMQGLCLRYNVTSDAIRMANRLARNEDIYTRRTLAIPCSPSVAQRRPPPTAEDVIATKKLMMRKMIRRFARDCGGLELSEAKYYLEERDYVYADSIALYNRDLRWEHTGIDKPKEDETKEKKVTVVRQNDIDIETTRETLLGNTIYADYHPTFHNITSDRLISPTAHISVPSYELSKKPQTSEVD